MESAGSGQRAGLLSFFDFDVMGGASSLEVVLEEDSSLVFDLAQFGSADGFFAELERILPLVSCWL